MAFAFHAMRNVAGVRHSSFVIVGCPRSTHSIVRADCPRVNGVLRTRLDYLTLVPGAVIYLEQDNNKYFTCCRCVPSTKHL